MVVYLTSSFIPYQDLGAYEKIEPGECCRFFDDLRKEWKNPSNILYIPCDPEALEENNHQLKHVLDAFIFKGLEVNEARIFDGKKFNSIDEAVSWADVVYLSGGHAPTQLAFMNSIGLKKALLNYDGIVIGLSAGSVNAAFFSYQLPELPGEATDPNFNRFAFGLDLTNIQIIPHSDAMKDFVIDGLRFIDDVVLPDSYGQRFYMISDGSYFKIKKGKTVFCGTGSIIEDGSIRPLKEGTIVPYMSYIEQPVVKTILEDGYDLVVTVEKQTEKCEVYYLQDRLAEVLESSKLLYKDICFKLSQNVVEEDREAFLDEIRLSVVLPELAEKGSFVRTIHVYTSTGRRAKNIRVMNIPGYPDWILVVYLDVTMALDHDWMTDEYTRIGFLERAKLFISELSADDHYSLVYTNVKGFKVVNELFGDQNGDLMIFQTRNVLKKYLKPVIMGRLESDHFAMITSDEYLSESNLKKMYRQSLQIESKEYAYEIRCGIYKIGNSSAEVTQLLAGAKLAEKSIKDGREHRQYAYYDDVMKENYIKQTFLLSEFERALYDGEFMPYYQPIVDAITGEVVSCEMLIRWRHRDMGMVSPGDFVPIFESEGKISALDNFMVERGMVLICKQKHQRKKIVPCAINLSRVDFYDSAFIESIFERMKDLDIDPSMIRFEVTESAYADLESKAMDYLNRMKKEGIKILLDDYGSGMSSLSMLETFDFDILKLDIGFIRKIGVSDKVESIISSTINLAHLLGAKVTAEGVETEEQLKFLQLAECDYIQGYYFYKPLSEKEFEEVLNK
jgi:EAL domain-containing protein (putative c-di-GMP-specific phosphodiesterase class I)/GGDEF domain-containing protein/peptidase E